MSSIVPFPMACALKERCDCAVPNDGCCPHWQPVRFTVRCMRCRKDTLSYSSYVTCCFYCGSEVVTKLP